MMRALAVLCGLLVAVIAAEAWSGWNGDDGTGHAQRSAPVAPRTAAHGTQKGSREQWVATVLQRPLFAPDRRPEGGAVAADPALPRLTGIIAFADEAVAIFQAGNGKPMAVRHGASVGGWEVMRIALDGVSLQKADHRVVLVPRLAAAQGGGTVTAKAKPTPSRWEVAPPTGLLRARWSNPQLQP